MNVALHYLQTIDTQTPTLLWISLSNFDKIGHDYGPHSYEMIDLLYHIDHQLQSFMEKVYQRYAEDEVMLVITADHGSGPFLEYMKLKEFPAHHTSISDLIERINNRVFELHGIEALVTHFKNITLYINQQLWNALDTKKQQEIEACIKEELLKLPGMKRVWTYDELEQSAFDPYTVEWYFKHQLYPGRSGHFIVQLQPYHRISSRKHGLEHTSPYNYDVHVPLLFYQPNHLTAQKIMKKIWIPQVAKTLAQLAGVEQPSASTFEVLPGIFE